MPSDLYNLYESKVKITSTNGRSIGGALLAAVIIFLVIVAIFALVVILQGGQRKIAVQYSKSFREERWLVASHHVFH